ncbi:MAG: tRNA (N6-threonylcarbamoyladenosine(37)-N6)-methyltransferase TrmO [Akkermansiaceae bacterium]|nr:tRNA (N6-threonylcarbamoyladenosine(37)-N6)-methyltransferase TrmO [Akkermansiaceae bacterium]
MKNVLILSIVLGCLGHGVAAPEGDGRRFTMQPIGTVQKKEGTTTVVIAPEFAEGLLHLDRYSHLWVIWWFDRNDNPDDRDVLRVIPRGNDANGVAGVFATRSQFRPNLVAMTLCRIKKIDGNRIELDGIDAWDDTPVIDLKPYIPAIDRAEDVRTADWKAPGKKAE